MTEEDNTRKKAIEKLINKHKKTPNLDWVTTAASLREKNPKLTEVEKYEIALYCTPIVDRDSFDNFNKEKTVDSVINFALNNNILPPLHIIREFGVKPETAKRVVEAHMKSPEVNQAWIPQIISAVKTSGVTGETAEIIVNWAMNGDYPSTVFEAIQLKKIPELTETQAQILLAKCIAKKDLPNAIKTVGFLNRMLTTEEIEQLSV